MQFKDYLTVKQYYLNNAMIFNNICQCNSSDIISSNHNKKQSDVINLYKIVLIAAKCYYLQSQYSHVIEILGTKLSLDKSIQNYPFKIIYERQLLLIKSLYLFKPSDILILEQTRDDYYHHKSQAKDWIYFGKATEYYDGNFQYVSKLIIAGSIFIKNSIKMINSNNVNNQTNLQILLYKKMQRFEGIPVYLLSKKWLQKLINFNKNTQIKQINNYPGPPLNLQLLNHIFQFQIHTHKSKQYMDTLLFPVVQGIDYVIISKNVWEIIVNQFGSGIPIIRYIIYNDMLKDIKLCDSLSKMILQCNNKQFVLQWQRGTYWQKTVLPTLSQQFLGPGQLKQMIYYEDNKKNKYIVQYRVVQSGIVGQLKNRYKYIRFSQHVIKIIPDIMLKKIKMKYDLEEYYLEDMENNGYSKGIIGIAQQVDTEMLYKIVFDKNGVGYKWQNNVMIKQFIQLLRDVINAILQSLSCLYELSCFFITNTFIFNLNDKWKKKCFNKIVKYENNNLHQFTMAYAHVIKKLWCSDSNMQCINGSMFTREYLLQKLSVLAWRKKEYEIQNQFKSYSHFILSQILTYLHEDIALIQRSSSSQQSTVSQNSLPPYFYSSLQKLQNTFLKASQKNSNSLIQNLLNIYGYNMQICQNCQRLLGYRFVIQWILNVQVEEIDVDVVKMFFVFGSLDVNQNNCYDNPKNEDKKNEVTQKKRGNKIVQQIQIKIKISNQIKDIYQIISKYYGLPQKSLLSNDKQICYHFVTVITDENIQQCQLITPTKTIKQLNMLLKSQKIKSKDSKPQKKIMFIFFVNQVKNDEKFTLISFRNQTTKKNKGFPQIVLSNKVKKISKINQVNIKQLLYNPSIQIQQIQLIPPKHSSPTTSHPPNLIPILYITTPTKIGSKQRTSSKLNLQFQNISKFNTNQKYLFSLEKLISQGYCQNGENLENNIKYQLCDNKEEQFRIVQGENVMCKKCNNVGTKILKRRLLEVRKILIISINQQKAKDDHLMQRVTYPIKNLCMKQYLKNYESLPKKKQISFIYNLKSMIFSNQNIKQYLNQKQLFQSNNENNCNSSKKSKYVCIAKNSLNNRWYLYHDECVREVNVQQFTNYSPEILIYERQQQKSQQKHLKNSQIAEVKRKPKQQF